jgi:hypothetical protein
VPRCAFFAAALDSTEVLYAGELEIHPGEGLVLASGRALTLSVREVELLAAMARRAGAIVVTRGELYRAVWGPELHAGDRSVDAYVSKLRGKLEARDARSALHPHPSWLRLSLPAAARAMRREPAGAGGDAGQLSRDVHITATGN